MTDFDNERRHVERQMQNAGIGFQVLWMHHNVANRRDGNFTFSRGFTSVNIHVFKRLCAIHRTCLPLRVNLSHKSIIRPSSEIVTTCHGMNLPEACNAFFAASSRPPQHGTSMRTMVTDVMSFSRMISVSFSE